MREKDTPVAGAQQPMQLSADTMAMLLQQLQAAAYLDNRKCIKMWAYSSDFRRSTPLNLLKNRDTYVSLSNYSHG